MSPYVIPGLQQKKRFLMGSKLKGDVIIEVICRYFHVSRSWLMENNRIKERVQARHITMYFLRKKTNMPLIEIAGMVRNKKMDHATILHGVEMVEGQLATRGYHASKKQVAEIDELLMIEKILQ